MRAPEASPGHGLWRLVNKAVDVVHNSVGIKATPRYLTQGPDNMLLDGQMQESNTLAKLGTLERRLSLSQQEHDTMASISSLAYGSHDIAVSWIWQKLSKTSKRMCSVELKDLIF